MNCKSPCSKDEVGGGGTRSSREEGGGGVSLLFEARGTEWGWRRALHR